MSKKLLLADDSITIQKVIGITFAKEDYELTVVDNGDAAFEKALEVRPDLILADVFMPGKNGYEVCAAVKQNPLLSGTPVLLLTGTFEPFDEDKARAVGADGWIAKPFESQALINRVEKLLSQATQPVQTPTLPAVTVLPVLSAPAPAASAVPATPVGTPEPESAPDLWDDLEVGTPETPTSLPAATSPPADEDLWGSIAFDAEELQPAPAPVETVPSPPPVPAAAPEATVPSEEMFIFEDEQEENFLIEEPVPSSGQAAVPAGADTEWGAFEDDILALDETDILDAEDLVDDESIFAIEEPPSALPVEAASGPQASLASGEEFVFEEESPTLVASGPTDTGPEVLAPIEEFVFDEEEPAGVTTDVFFPEETDQPEEPMAVEETTQVEAGTAAGDWDFPVDEPIPATAALRQTPEPALAADDWGFPVEKQTPAAAAGGLAPEPDFEADDWGFPVEETAPAATVEKPAPMQAGEPSEWGFPAEESVPPAAPVQAAVVLAPAPGLEERVVALSDADLERIVEKVAGAVVERLANTILEKIAWEIVPDLAEALIREELRKIKEHAA